MPDTPPGRLWLLLLILDAAGPLYSKVRFQKIAFLAQHEGRIDEYDFVKHYYGPYSDGLDLDAASYPSLIAYGVARPYNAQDHRYYIYEITEEGKSVLGSITGRMDAGAISAMAEMIARMSRKPRCDLLEEAHGRFAPKREDSPSLESQVSEEMSKVIPPTRNIFDRHKSVQAISILSVLDMAGMVLSEAKTTDAVQRGVILNLSKEIIQQCKDIARSIRPGEDDDDDGPPFAEINDLFHCLTQYCKTRGLARDPMEIPLGEMMTGDEAERLSKALWECEIPK